MENPVPAQAMAFMFIPNESYLDNMFNGEGLKEFEQYFA
jgi:hypothetical protein